MIRLRISKRGIDLIKEFEGCQLKAYRDSVGVWTIGWGTTNADRAVTGEKIFRGLRIRQETADLWLEQCLYKKYGPVVDAWTKKYHWTQHEFDALVSFTYNLGSGNFLSLIDHGHRSKSTIAKKILEYNHGGGVVVRGLTRRRKAEHDLFVKPCGKHHYSGTYPVLPPRGYFMLGDGKTQLKDYPTQIKRCQKLLAWMGYYDGPIDGIYGKKCASGVRSLQDKHGLPVSGCFGKRCMRVAHDMVK